MKRVGASTAATASPVAADSLAAGVGSSVASAVAAGDADSLAAGVVGADAVSESDAGREITTIARRAMPMIAAIKTRGDVPCLGLALGFGAAGALFAGVGIVVIFARDEFDVPPTGTGGTTNLLAEVPFLAAAFLRAGAFLATFLAVDFFTAFLAVFLTTFLAAAFFFAGAFFATFLAAAFLRAGAFLATFFTEAFFLTATMKLLLGLSDLVWAKFSLEN